MSTKFSPLGSYGSRPIGPGLILVHETELLSTDVFDRFRILFPKDSGLVLVTLSVNGEPGRQVCGFLDIADPIASRWYLAHLTRGSVIRAHIQNASDVPVMLVGRFSFRLGAEAQ